MNIESFINLELSGKTILLNNIELIKNVKYRKTLLYNGVSEINKTFIIFKNKILDVSFLKYISIFLCLKFGLKLYLSYFDCLFNFFSLYFYAFLILIFCFKKFYIINEYYNFLINKIDINDDFYKLICCSNKVNNDNNILIFRRIIYLTISFILFFSIYYYFFSSVYSFFFVLSIFFFNFLLFFYLNFNIPFLKKIKVKFDYYLINFLLFFNKKIFNLFFLSNFLFKIYFIFLLYFYHNKKYIIKNTDYKIIRHFFYIILLIDFFYIIFTKTIFDILIEYFTFNIKFTKFFKLIYFFISFLFFIKIFFQIFISSFYTKISDVSADLFGKFYLNKEDDDKNNPIVIADNVGDIIGDYFVSIYNKRIISFILLFFLSIYYNNFYFVIFIFNIFIFLLNQKKNFILNFINFVNLFYLKEEFFDYFISFVLPNFKPLINTFNNNVFYIDKNIININSIFNMFILSFTFFSFKREMILKLSKNITSFMSKFNSFLLDKIIVKFLILSKNKQFFIELNNSVIFHFINFYINFILIILGFYCLLRIGFYIILKFIKNKSKNKKYIYFYNFKTLTLNICYYFLFLLFILPFFAFFIRFYLIFFKESIINLFNNINFFYNLLFICSFLIFISIFYYIVVYFISIFNKDLILIKFFFKKYILDNYLFSNQFKIDDFINFYKIKKKRSSLIIYFFRVVCKAILSLSLCIPLLYLFIFNIFLCLYMIFLLIVIFVIYSLEELSFLSYITEINVFLNMMMLLFVLTLFIMFIFYISNVDGVFLAPIKDTLGSILKYHKVIKYNKDIKLKRQLLTDDIIGNGQAYFDKFLDLFFSLFIFVNFLYFVNLNNFSVKSIFFVNYIYYFVLFISLLSVFFLIVFFYVFLIENFFSLFYKNLSYFINNYDEVQKKESDFKNASFPLYICDNIHFFMFCLLSCLVFILIYKLLIIDFSFGLIILELFFGIVLFYIGNIVNIYGSMSDNNKKFLELLYFDMKNIYIKLNNNKKNDIKKSNYIKQMIIKIMLGYCNSCINNNLYFNENEKFLFFCSDCFKSFNKNKKFFRENCNKLYINFNKKLDDKKFDLDVYLNDLFGYNYLKKISIEFDLLGDLAKDIIAPINISFLNFISFFMLLII